MSDAKKTNKVTEFLTTKRRRSRHITDGNTSNSNSTKNNADEDEIEEIVQNKCPYGKQWMDNCFRSLAYPNRICVSVLQDINSALPRNVLRPQTSEFKQQALFLLLGQDFTEHHFPNHKYNVHTLDLLKIKTNQKQKYIAEMKEFLKKAVALTMKDLGYPQDMSLYHKTEDNMGKFIQEIRESFTEAFQKYVAKAVHQKEAKTGRNDSSDKREQLRSSHSGVTLGVTYGDEGEVAGQVFVDFMEYNDTQFDHYKNVFRHNNIRLPPSLGKFIWWRSLFHTKTDKLNTETIITEFSEHLKKQMAKQKIKLNTKSQKRKEINQHIVEIYENCIPFKSLDLEVEMTTITKVVNMAEIHSGNYTPVGNLLALPFVINHCNDLTNNQTLPILAINVCLYSESFQLKPKEIFRIADDIIDRLKKKDLDYFNHIKSCLLIKPNHAEPKDFLPEYFLKNKETSLNVFQHLLDEGHRKEEDVRKRYEQELTQPNIFIRKWIGQAFVGILSLNSMMWTWDQLFMDNWSREVIKNIALCILILIKPWMLRATMHSGARKVFLEEPSKIYTKDLRAAFSYLTAGSPISEVPENSNFVDATPIQNKRRASKISTVSSGRESLINRPKWLVPVLPFGSATEAFNLDINLADEPLPEEEPNPDVLPSRISRDADDSPPASPPPYTSSPTLSSSPPPSPNERGWVTQDIVPSWEPKTAHMSEPFDFYVDYVRFLPDAIRVCKVTGRFLHSNLPKNAFKDFKVYPILQSFQRSPTFRYKQTVNPHKEDVNSDALFLLKVYGYQTTHGAVVSVGTCLFCPFSSSSKSLRAGGHQVRLRHGGLDGADEKESEQEFKKQAPVPAMSICIRVLKADKIYDPRPRYEDGYYESRESKPTGTELRLFFHYTRDSKFKSWRVSDELQQIAENKGKSTRDEEELQKLMSSLLSHKRNRSTSELDYSTFVKYDNERGVNICIQGAFGLPDSCEWHYSQAYGEVLPGKRTEYDSASRRKERLHVLTERIDMRSAHRAPDWLDLKTAVYPSYDDYAVFLVLIFSIGVKFSPGSKGVSERNDGSMQIDFDNPIAWGVVPIFENGFAQGGLHLAALFKGSPKKEVLSMLERDRPVGEVLAKCVAKRLITPEKDSLLEVEIYDGHVEAQDLPEPLNDAQLRQMAIEDTAIEARNQNFGPTFADFVLENLSKSDKRKGVSGSTYEKEQFTFQKEVNLQFLTSMNKALKRAGKPEFKV